MKRLRSRLENPASTRLFPPSRALRPPSLHKEGLEYPPAPPLSSDDEAPPPPRGCSKPRPPAAPLGATPARAPAPKSPEAACFRPSAQLDGPSREPERPQRPEAPIAYSFSRFPIIAYRGAIVARTRLHAGAGDELPATAGPPRGPERVGRSSPPPQSQERPSPQAGAGE